MPIPFIDTQDLSDLLGRDVTADAGALQAIDSACDMIRALTEQDFNRGTSTETLDGTGTDVLLLPQRPLNAVLGTVTVNGQPEPAYSYASSGQFFRGSAGGYPRPLWPMGRQNVTVTYDHGYDEVPRDIRQVAVQIAMRVLVQGVAMSETVGDVTVTYGAPAFDLTKNEERILAGYLNARSFWMPISTFLNGRAPDRLRGAQFLAFSDVAIIQTPTATSDSGGGASRVWANAGTVPCRIYPVTLRGKGALVGGQVNEHSTHFCAMPAETDINVTDRVAIQYRGTFEVTVALETTDALTTRVEVIQVT